MQRNLLTIVGCVAALAIGSLALAADEPAAAPEKLGEGWRKEVQVGSDGTLCTVFVEQGWLQVKQQAPDGQLEWHIVLAKATDPTPPVITLNDKEFIKLAAEKGFSLPIRVDVTYQNGQYFVREYEYYLRCFRQKKSVDDKDWPRLALPSEKVTMSASGSGIGTAFQSWSGNSWFFTAVGPAADAFDCIVRLNHLDLRERGNGVQVNRVFIRGFHDDHEIIDEGDLLISKRATDAYAKAEVAERAIKKNQIGAPAPDIDGTTWLNTSTPLPWSELKGRVVLLDFWGTWCGPCVKKLPQTQELANKFKDQGLVVIGVHSSHGADDLEEFLKARQVDFPIVVDAGTTATQYAVSAWPTYFLIDRDGKIVKRDPSDKQIEQLVTGGASAKAESVP